MLVLVAILAAALVLRLAPTLFYPIWGSDTGEYAFIARHLATTGELPIPYDGWGSAYPYFPGMHALVAQVSVVTGWDALDVLRVLVPAANVVLVAGVYLLGRRLSGRRSGLAAAAVAAVIMPLVFTGSHPMPESLAHGLAVVVLVLALDADRPTRFGAALVLGLAVVVTHHLTTYFLVLALAALWLGRVVTTPDPAWPRLGLAVAVGAAAVAYWLGVATPFRDRILAQVTSPILVVAASGAAVAVAVAVGILRTRTDRTWRVPDSRPGQAPWLGAVLFASTLALTGAFALFGLPGLTFDLDPAVLPWYLPFLALLLFVPLGTMRLRRGSEGMFLYAWIGLVSASFVGGALLAPTVLIPYRHVPFLAVPLSLLVGAGLSEIDPSGIRKAVPVAVVVLLAVTAYPPPSALGGFQEGVTAEEMQAVRWAGDNLPEGSVFLADHRLSSMLFGFAAMDPTWDAEGEAWHATTWEAARPHLANASTPTGPRRVQYVLVSPQTVQGVALHQWDPARPLSDAALSKFDDAPFQTIYEADGVRIHRIAWAEATSS